MDFNLEIVIKTKELKYRYDAGASLEFPDFSCTASEHLLLHGESGSGKTTLLHLLAGILKPVQGEIWIRGSDIGQLKPAAMDRFRGRHIGLIFQHHYFIRSVSVWENLLAAQYLTGQKPDKARLKSLVERLGIKGLEGKKPDKLSMGEKQRFSVARALANAPKLLLADEPTSSLDDANCTAFIELIAEQAAQHNASLIVASHDARLLSRFQTQLRLSKK